MQDEYQVSAILDKESYEILNKRANKNERSVSAELRVILKELKV